MFKRIWIFMICCLVVTQPVLALDEETVFTLNEINVRVKPHCITEFDFQIDDDHCIMFMQNRGGKLVAYCQQEKEKRCDQARASYADISTCSPANYNTLWRRNSHKLMWQNLVATGGPITLSDAQRIDAENNILCTREKVTLCAQTLCLKNTFCTSGTGQVTLKAPEGSTHWLRALTFERAPGERPFDMMFEGTVSFNSSTIETLVVLGANKVSIQAQRLD